VVAGSPRALEARSAMAPAATMTYDRICDPINPPATKLLPGFRQNGGRYFNTDERDFVAVYSC
jgi:hypothetical protein